MIFFPCLVRRSTLINECCFRIGETPTSYDDLFPICCDLLCPWSYHQLVFFLYRLGTFLHYVRSQLGQTMNVNTSCISSPYLTLYYLCHGPFVRCDTHSYLMLLLLKEYKQNSFIAFEENCKLYIRLKK